MKIINDNLIILNKLCNNDITHNQTHDIDKVDDSDTVIYEGKYYSNECVIKIVKNDSKVGIKSKVIREISFLRKIKHKFLIKLYDVFYDTDYIYIIMEKGEIDVLNIKHAEINANVLDNVLLDNVLLALKFIEQNRYIHGDLNFSNIIMLEDSKKEKIFKLIDFGSSTRIYRINAIKK